MVKACLYEPSSKRSRGDNTKELFARRELYPIHQMLLGGNPSKKF